MLISSSEDELSEYKDVITVSSDEMCNEVFNDSGYTRNPDNHDIREGSRTLANNGGFQLSLGPRDTSSSSDPEPTIRNTQSDHDVDNLQSHSSTSGDNHNGELGKLKLQEVFGDKLSAEQTASIYKISGENFTVSMECLLSGPTLQSILMIMHRRYAEQPVIKVDVEDITVAWEDAVTFYKSSRFDISKQIRVRINDQPVIDVGGVRAQLYSTVYGVFAQNEKITLFDGNVRYLRPHCSAEARSSGLFKILGMMIGHSIMQDGIGFPYISPVCYWYVAGKEQKALESLSVKDLNEDVGFLVTKVYFYVLTCVLAVSMFMCIAEGCIYCGRTK